MRAQALTLILPVYVIATGCGGGTTPAGPSPVQVDTPATATISVTGSVRDANNNAVLPGSQVQVMSGPDASRSATTDASGNFTLSGLKVGLFTIRFSRAGYETVDRPLNASSDARVDVRLRPGASCIAPQPPTGFRATVAGSRVTFVWDPPPGATSYLIVVGSAPGGSNTMSTNTTQTTFLWRGAPIGTHYARVFARNDCAHDAVSNEISFTVASS